MALRRYIKTNLLPNVYQGLYYVRTTRQTDKFMKTANSVFNNSEVDHLISKSLIKLGLPLGTSLLAYSDSWATVLQEYMMGQ